MAAVKYFPVFVALEGRRIALSGGGDAALAKLRLLLKTEARITVFAPCPAPDIETWAAAGRIALIRRSVAQGDIVGATLFYAADECATEDARTTALAREEGALANIVDNLHDSDFITPAIVDRDPVTVAIGTEGTAPVLARRIKADIEALLPASLGALARAARRARGLAEALPMGRVRRGFWARFLLETGPRALAQSPGADLDAVLRADLARHLAAEADPGQVHFAIVASADPDLLTLRTRRLLHEADIVLHDAQIAPEVLELARREATFGPLPDTARPLCAAAARGDHVLCLMPAAPDARMLEACRAVGVTPQIVPGIAPLPEIHLTKEIA